jgi:hypothetical protein
MTPQRILFAIMCACVIGAASTYFAGWARVHAIRTKLEVLWPNSLHIPLSDRVALLMAADQCRLDRQPSEPRLIAKCLLDGARVLDAAPGADGHDKCERIETLLRSSPRSVLGQVP